MGGGLRELGFYLVKENVEGEHEQERREGAPLLDPPLDSNGGRPFQVGGGRDPMKEPFNHVNDPVTYLYFLKSLHQEGVIDGIESFPGIKEQNPQFFVVLEVAVVSVD